MLRLLIVLNGAKPCRKYVFEEGESGIVELCLFFMKLLATGKGGFQRVNGGQK